MKTLKLLIVFLIFFYGSTFSQGSVSPEFSGTVDFLDNVWRSKSRLSKENIRNMMRHYHSIGLKRVDWIFLPSFLETYRGMEGATDVEDALKTIVSAAHDNHLEIVANIKVLESGPAEWVIPHFFPRLSNAVYKKNLKGYHYFPEPFFDKYPDSRIARFPSAKGWENTTLEVIKIMGVNTEESSIVAGDIELFLSKINGEFVKFSKSLNFQKLRSSKNGIPTEIIVLSNLGILPEWKYFIVKCRTTNSSFEMLKGHQSVQAFSENGVPMPVTLDAGVWDRKEMVNHIRRHYLLFSDDKTFTKDIEKLPLNYGVGLENSAFQFMAWYGAGKSRFREKVFLDGNKELKNSTLNGYVTFFKGEYENYESGQPGDKRIEGFWLGQFKKCLELGFDGVELRLDNHSTDCEEPLRYGFGPSIQELYKKKFEKNLLDDDFSIEEWRKIQGDAFTQFIRDLKGLVRSYNKKFILEINGTYVKKPSDWVRNNIPTSIDWQWRDWILEDLADEYHLKHLPWVWRDGVGEKEAKEAVEMIRAKGKKVIWDWRFDMWYLTTIPGDPKDLNVLSKANLSKVLKRAAWGFKTEGVDYINLYELFDIAYEDPKTGRCLGSPAFSKIFESIRKGGLGSVEIKEYPTLVTNQN